MTTNPLPHDLEAEDAVLSDLLFFPDKIAEVAQRLAPADFYNTMAGTAYALIVSAWRAGRPHDLVSLLDALEAKGYNPHPQWAIDLPQTGYGAVLHHVDTVIRKRAARQLIAAATEAATAARSGVDPFDATDALAAALVGITAPTSDPTSDLHSLDEFMDAPAGAEAEWVVDGLLRRGWRAIIVGSEGLGKSVVFRQFAVLAAQGLHPLEFRPIPRVRTLLIDLENPEDAIRRSCVSLRDSMSKDGYEPGRAWLWHRPSGIDLRSRTARAEFEANLQACRPDLVCLGPLYKAYHRKGTENDEQAVAEVQAMLDDLRTRYGFALLLEHHAPQEQGGHRQMRPYGSSLWLRWPELGLGMERVDPENPDDRSVNLKRWRGDRMTNSWPKRMEQGFQFPWVGA